MCGSQTKESKTFTVSHGFDENVIFFDQPKQQKRGWAQILGYQKSGRGAIRNLNKKITSNLHQIIIANQFFSHLHRQNFSVCFFAGNSVKTHYCAIFQYIACQM